MIAPRQCWATDDPACAHHGFLRYQLTTYPFVE
jgi:hypothetical protein